MKPNKRKKQYIDIDNKKLQGYVFGKINIRKQKRIASGSKACET